MSAREDMLDIYFDYVFKLALNSPDPSTQNAAIVLEDMGSEGSGAFPILISGGCNDFPAGVAPRLQRPEKYTYIEHAERNAIYIIPRCNTRTKTGELFMVALWASCADCARGIIQSGIRTLFRHQFYSSYSGPDSVDRMPWQDSIDAGDTMMREAGVDIFEYNWHSRGRQLLFNGELVSLGGE